MDNSQKSLFKLSIIISSVWDVLFLALFVWFLVEAIRDPFGFYQVGWVPALFAFPILGPGYVGSIVPFIIGLVKTRCDNSKEKVKLMVTNIVLLALPIVLISLAIIFEFIRLILTVLLW